MYFEILLFVKRYGWNDYHFLFELFPVLKEPRSFFLDWKLSKSTIVSFCFYGLIFDLCVGVAFGVADTLL